MKKKNSSSDIHAEMILLEKKIKKTDLKFEILKNAGQCILHGKPKIFEFIKENESRYSIRLMTEVLSANRREYHRWKKKPLNDTQLKKILMQRKITSIFFVARRRYGSERISVELENSGFKLCSRTVRKYMSELGLSARGKNY